MPSNLWHTRINKKIFGLLGQQKNISEEVIKEINTLIDAPSRDFAGGHRKFYHDHLSILLPVLVSKTNLSIDQKKILVRMIAKNAGSIPESNVTKIMMYLAIAGGSAVDPGFLNRYLSGLLHIKTDEYFDRVFK
jgi:hypothetical protein